LAVKLSDVRVTGVDPRDQIIKTVRDKINRKDLAALVDKDNASVRYPKNMFLQRNHTFVPGHEAYDEVCMKSVSNEVFMTFLSTHSLHQLTYEHTTTFR
jgi:hypothetical protein